MLIVYDFNLHQSKNHIEVIKLKNNNLRQEAFLRLLADFIAGRKTNRKYKKTTDYNR